MKTRDKIKSGLKRLFNTLKDKTNILIFVIVFLVLSSEVWCSYLIGLITGNAWWFGIASVCWLFWLGPFTPFLPLCLAITFAVRKVIDKIRKTQQKRNDGLKTAFRLKDIYKRATTIQCKYLKRSR